MAVINDDAVAVVKCCCSYSYLKKLAQMGAGKSVPEYFVREKEKWTYKGTDKQYVNDSVKHSTTCHYQISRS